MLSLFPELLDWSWYTPILFRGFITIYLFTLAFELFRKHHKGDKKLADAGFALLLTIIALSLLLGVYVQIVGAIGFSLSMTALLFKGRYKKELPESAWFYTLLGLTSLSLVFLGAGPYAFDLPL